MINGSSFHKIHQTTYNSVMVPYFPSQWYLGVESNLIEFICHLGTGHYLWLEVAPKRNYFFRKFCLTQVNFVSKIFLLMRLKPIIFLYPTNYTFLSNLCTRRWLEGSIQLRYQVVKGGEKQEDKRHPVYTMCSMSKGVQ